MSGDALGALLARLTPQPEKVAAYRGDTYVAESVEQLERLGLDPAAFAIGHSMLLLKPDAIVARAVDPALKWLHDNGYRVIAAEVVPVNRHLARALWYYAWNIASPERRRLADLLVGISDALLLVVTAPDDPIPVSLRLARAKGPTDPRKRRPGELRHLLGRDNYLLNLVHTPDDPADVLRELAIYFPEHARAEVIAAVGDAPVAPPVPADRARALAEELYARTPERSFDPGTALERIRADLGASDSDDYPTLLDTALTRGTPVDPWSAIVLGSQVLPMRTGTEAQTLRPVTATDWTEKFG
ncbi:nucleoside-diphosphate kinase [Nocardia asteroides]|uniref:nucleoside-diphosphate kinase n=1 Tax=Nocardia asteroides TaxID=1824 RepID=UPI001E537FE4|nr:nucleoside-diphosphate kinase [Nocardia asteroides]UGT61219.1 nucleoside-diphosphate kinase [Nocardia asteroides]